MHSRLPKSQMREKATKSKRSDWIKDIGGVLEVFLALAGWDPPSAWPIRDFLSLLFHFLSLFFHPSVTRLEKNEQKPLIGFVPINSVSIMLVVYSHHFASTFINGEVDIELVCWHGWSLLVTAGHCWSVGSTGLLMLRTVHGYWIVGSDFQLRKLRCRVTI